MNGLREAPAGSNQQMQFRADVPHFSALSALMGLGQFRLDGISRRGERANFVSLLAEVA
jgi:hypothetical protein